jgi:hypothetical protein
MATAIPTIKIAQHGIRAGRIVILGSLGILSIILAIKMIRKSVAKSAGKRIVDDQNVRFATLFYTYINPTAWFKGADEDAILRMAETIDNYDDIAKEYSNLYERSLTHDLQDVLDELYPEFVVRLQKAKSGNTSIDISQAVNLAERLHDELEVVQDYQEKDLTSLEELNLLNDNNFLLVTSEYNNLFGKNLAEVIKNEPTYLFFPTIYYNMPLKRLKEKLIERFKGLGLI